MSSRFPASLIAMLVGLTATSFGEEPLPSHTLLGTVTDSHAASLAGVTVELSNQAPTLQPLIPGTPGNLLPAGPRRRVVCGLTMVPPPQKVDPKIVVPNQQPNRQRPVTPTMRTVQPAMCWDPAPLAPSAPPR